MSNYYLGGDASKGYCDFVVLDAEKNIVERNFQLDDTAAGHQALFKLLKGFLDKHPDSTLYAALESTGGYENNWYERLKDFGHSLPVYVARLNPAMVKADHEAGLRRNKTDPLSARDVAAYQISHPEKVKYDEDSFPMMRKSWKFIQMLKKQKHQLINQLDSLLYISMPELLSFCRDGYPQWLLQLLRLYSTYEAIHAAGIQELKTLPYMTSKKAEKLLKRLQPGQTIGSSDCISGQLIQALAEQILQLDLQIKHQKKVLEKNCDEAKDTIALLISFKGIGVFSAVGLLLNIIDINRFPTVKELVSYFGLHPELKSSGDGVWRMCMSKKGRSEPRAILYMIAMSAICHNPLIKELYEKKINEGMPRKAAIGVCMHKILRVVYGMLKHKIPFDPNIDKINRAKSPDTITKPKKDKNRRLQEFDENAPISRRQNKKRKELQQTDNQDSGDLKTSEPKSRPERECRDWVKLGAILSSYPQPPENK